MTRAQDVERELRARLDRLTWEFSPTVTPMRKLTVSKMIDWQSSGVGAAEPDTQNVKRHRTPANMTEEDRKLNRRVEIYLAPGTTPVRRPPSPPGKPEIPWVLPKRQDRQTFLDVVKALNETLGFLDVDTILGVLHDNMVPGDHDWTQDFRKDWQKLEDDRRLRNDVPPRRGVDPIGGDK